MLDESFLFAKTRRGISLGSSLSILCDASSALEIPFESMTKIITSMPEVSIEYTYSRKPGKYSVSLTPLLIRLEVVIFIDIEEDDIYCLVLTSKP